MAITVASNFDLVAALPLDGRTVVADTTARDAIASGVRYEGMIVYVVADGTNYQLVGGTTNSDWAELSGSGGGGSFITTIEEVDNSDSPVTLSESDASKFVVANAVSGNIAISLPGLSGLSALMMIAVKKSDLSTNTVAVSPDGTDGIDADSILNLTVPEQGAILIGDPAATEWRTIRFGPNEFPDRGVSTFTGTSVSPDATMKDQTFVYTGGSVQSFTGFGSLSGLTNGYRATLMGSSDTNYLSISESDTSDGWIMNGPVDLQLGMNITFEYNSTLGRMVETPWR